MIKVIGQNSLFNEFEKGTIEECVEYLNSLDIISLDIETCRKHEKGTYKEVNYKAGLDPKLTKICMIQIGTDELGFIIDARSIDFSFLKPILEDKNKLKIIHNTKFESMHFLEAGIRIQNVHDTMLAENILYNGYHYSYSLEALEYKYFGIKSVEEYSLFDNISDENRQVKAAVTILRNKYALQGRFPSEEDLVEEAIYQLYEKNYINKSIRLGFIDIGSKPFTKKQILYGFQDIEKPFKIYKEQIKGRRLHDNTLYKPLKAFAFQSMFATVVAEITWRGFTIDVNKWKEAVEIDTVTYLKRLEMLNQFVIDKHPKFATSLSLFSDKPECNIQWTSSTQVVRFFKDLKICPKNKSKSTGKLEYTVGATTLFTKLSNEYKIKFFKNKDVDKIETTDDIYLQYLLFKKSEQAITTFGNNFIEKYVHPITGKIHSNYQTYKNTTRLSSTRPKMLGGNMVTYYLNYVNSGEAVNNKANPEPSFIEIY